MAEPSHTQRNEALQILRAVAAGIVVVDHAILNYAGRVGPTSDVDLAIGLGDLGVKLFFCISGFIVFKSTVVLEPGVQSASLFARRRLIRIVPLYWCMTLVYALKLALGGAAPGTRELAYSLLFFPYLDSSGLMRPVLGVGWTLNFEMFFYVALGLSLFLAKGFRLAAVCGVLLLMIFARSAGVPGTGESTPGSGIFLLFDTYLLFFVVGMCVGSIEQGKALSVLEVRWEISILIVAAVLLAYVTAMPKLAGFWLVTGELVLCAACVALCATGQSAGGRQTMIQRYAVLAGDGSYSTYLTHGFMIGPAARLLSATGIKMSPWLFSFGMVLVCTAGGMLIYRLLEQPLLAWMNARWGRGHATPVRRDKAPLPNP